MKRVVIAAGGRRDRKRQPHQPRLEDPLRADQPDLLAPEQEALLEERPRQALAMRRPARSATGRRPGGWDGHPRGWSRRRLSTRMVALMGTSDSSVVRSDLEAALRAAYRSLFEHISSKIPGITKKIRRMHSTRGVASWKSLRRTLIAALRVRADDELPRRRPLSPVRSAGVPPSVEGRHPTIAGSPVVPGRGLQGSACGRLPRDPAIGALSPAIRGRSGLCRRNGVRGGSLHILSTSRDTSSSRPCPRRSFPREGGRTAPTWRSRAKLQPLAEVKLFPTESRPQLSAG